MGTTDKQRLYQSHIAAAEAAGISLAEYAREQGIHPQCLYGENNRQRRKARKSLAGFVRVEQPVAPVVNSSLLQIRLPNGVSLAVPVDPVPVAQLITTLAAL
ncbi:MAG: hypothetical protein KDI36_05560 [Pseudomonadales bacterium]|nr:hypothetical protein [Pseudomonadales bacterium]